MNKTSDQRGDQISMFILDVMRHDVAEQVSSIVKLLNDEGGIGWRDCWPSDFTNAEVTQALVRLIQQGDVAIYAESSPNHLRPVVVETINHDDAVRSLWFGLTDAGKAKWAAWTPPQPHTLE